MKNASAAEQSVLADLVSLWQRRRGEGQAATPAELCREHPELLPELERHIRALERMDDLVGGRHETVTLDTAGSPRAVPLPAGWPEIPGYEILGELGRGGMGVVYQARDTQLKRLVALKMVLAGVHSSEDSRGRFRAEAEAVARLQHPHVVQVFSWGEHNGLPYLVMEHVAGGGLDRRLAGQPQPPADAARLVMLLARAVQAAHKAGVVHRDLKPANVLLAPAADEPALNTAYGWPKISDFGLARLSGGSRAQTASYDVLGTPCYMAPEQAAGKAREVGPPTDVYALGVILYELLTGRPPFKGESVLATLDQVRSLPPRPPHELCADVPAELEAICLRCLAKALQDRYPTAQALAEDLGAVLGSTTGLVKAVVPAEGAANQSGEREPHPKSSRRRGILLASMAVVGVLLATAAGYFLWPRGAGPIAGSDPSTGSSSNTASQPVSYKGYVDVRIWRKTADKSLRMRLTDDEALPLHDGDLYRIEANVTPAAYLYLFMINTEGEAAPVFPWNPQIGWSSRPAQESYREFLSLPEKLDKAWEFDGGKEGMETFLLLARPTPLDVADEAVRGWFKDIGPQRPVQNARSAVWFDNGRMVENDPRRTRAHFEERQLDDPLMRLQQLIQERLQPHAAFTTAVSFAKQGK